MTALRIVAHEGLGNVARHGAVIVVTDPGDDLASLPDLALVLRFHDATPGEGPFVFAAGWHLSAVERRLQLVPGSLTVISEVAI